MENIKLMTIDENDYSNLKYYMPSIDDLQQMADYFSVYSDLTRLKILSALSIRVSSKTLMWKPHFLLWNLPYLLFLASFNHNFLSFLILVLWKNIHTLSPWARVSCSTYGWGGITWYFLTVSIHLTEWSIWTKREGKASIL